jgi:hypothetical protein
MMSGIWMVAFAAGMPTTVLVQSKKPQVVAASCFFIGAR